jgi:hypothetical protein
MEQTIAVDMLAVILGTAALSAMLAVVIYRRWFAPREGSQEAVAAALTKLLEVSASSAAFYVQCCEQHSKHTDAIHDLGALVVRRTDLLERMAENVAVVKDRTAAKGEQQ